MSTATGNIMSTNGRKFTSVFIIDEIQYSFVGSLADSVQPFNCSDATLTYGSIDDITASRSFEGQVGVTKIRITLENGVTIAGRLNMQLSPATSISGSGTWTSN